MGSVSRGRDCGRRSDVDGEAFEGQLRRAGSPIRRPVEGVVSGLRESHVSSLPQSPINTRNEAGCSVQGPRGSARIFAELRADAEGPGHLLRGPWWPGYLDGPADPGRGESNHTNWFRAGSGTEMNISPAVRAAEDRSPFVPQLSRTEQRRWRARTVSTVPGSQPRTAQQSPPLRPLDHGPPPGLGMAGGKQGGLDVTVQTGSACGVSRIK